MSAGHYDEVAARYEAACFYDPGSAYHAWLERRVLAHLALAAGQRLVDVGGGAGGFSAALAERAGAEVLVVEPNAGLRAQAAARGLEVFAGDALAFAAAAGPACDRVLMKEVAHHLDPRSLGALYAGLARRLRPGGRLLTITRPREPSYPLFAAAREVWRENQPHAEVFARAQAGAGFSVTRCEEAFPLRMRRHAWEALIRGRCWSTFSAFSDAELEQGIQEVARAHPQAELAFEDRLIFLLARPAPA